MHDEIQLTVNKGKNGYSLHIGGAKTGINRDFERLYTIDDLQEKMGEMVTEYIGDCGNEDDQTLELIEANEELFAEAAMKDYHGSKDGWESYYDNWCSDLTLDEAKAILAK